MTDKKSTLQVVIDPKGAKKGADEAISAFNRMRKAAGSTVDFIKKISDSIGGSFIKSFNASVNAAKSFAKRISTVFSNLAKSISGVAKSVGSSFGGAFNKALNSVKLFANKFDSYLMQLSMATIRLAKSIGDAFGGAFSSAISAVKSFTGRFRSAFSNILGTISNIAKAIGGSLGNAFKSVTNIAKSFTKSLGTSLKGVSSTIGNISKSIISSFGNAFKSSNTSASAFAKGANTSMKSVSWGASNSAKAVSGSFKSGFSSAYNSAKAFGSGTLKVLGLIKKGVNSFIKGWAASFGKLFQLLLPLGVGGTVKKIISIGLDYQKFQTTMTVIEGSADKARESLTWLMKEVNRTGTSFEAAAAPFAKFAAASKGIIRPDDIRAIFSAFNEASAALHLNKQEMQGVFLALQQMASKGRLSMEELRLQLAERIPGAMRLAATAMGMDIKTLEDEIRKGTISAEDFLTKFAHQIHLKFGNAAEIASKSAIGALRRFQNALFEVGTALAHGGLLEAVGNMADRIARWVRDNRDVFVEMGAMLGNAAMDFTDWLTDFSDDEIEKVFRGVIDWSKTIGETIKGWATSVENTVSFMVQLVREAKELFSIRGFASILSPSLTSRLVLGEPELMDEIKKAKGDSTIQSFVGDSDPIDWDLTGSSAEVHNLTTEVEKLNSRLITSADIVDGFGNKFSEAVPLTLEEFNANIDKSLGLASDRAIISTPRDIRNDIDAEHRKINDAFMISTDPEDDGEFRINYVDKYAASIRKILELTTDLYKAELLLTQPLKIMDDKIELADKLGLSRERLVIAMEAENKEYAIRSNNSGEDLTNMLAMNEQLKVKRLELLGIKDAFDYSSEIDPVVAATRKLVVEQERLNNALEYGTVSAGAMARRMHDLKLEVIEAKISMGQMSEEKMFMEGMKEGLWEFSDDVSDVFTGVKDIMVSTLDGASNALADFVLTGSSNFKQFVDSIVADITRMVARMLVMKTIGSFFPGFMSPSFSMGSAAPAAAAPAWSPQPIAGGFAVGADKIANDGLANLHRGEAVIPAKQAEAYRKDKRLANKEGGTQPTTFVMNVTTQDSGSFKRSQSQIMNDMGRMLNAAQRRNS